MATSANVHELDSRAMLGRADDLDRNELRRAHASHAAAFCYRVTEAGLEVLLVRTKSGRWTLPKGHIEGEHGAVTARREALEEAGALGRVLTTAFDRYVDWKRSGTAVVDVYLLHVCELVRPAEHHRQPDWFRPKQAVRMLRRGRRRPYGLELRRVIASALALLGTIAHHRSYSRRHRTY